MASPLHALIGSPPATPLPQLGMEPELHPPTEAAPIEAAAPPQPIDAPPAAAPPTPPTPQPDVVQKLPAASPAYKPNQLAGGRKLVAKSKPFWELQLDKKKKAEQGKPCADGASSSAPVPVEPMVVDATTDGAAAAAVEPKAPSPKRAREENSQTEMTAPTRAEPKAEVLPSVPPPKAAEGKKRRLLNPRAARAQMEVFD